MTKSTFKIVACVLAILLLRIQELETAEIGDKCDSKDICRTGVCVAGICQNSSLKKPSKCGDLFCQPGQTCVYPLVRCREGAICSTPPPKCLPEPVGEKCGNITCKPGETCFNIRILIKCPEGSKCIPPPPRCVKKPVNPCENITCGEGYECVTSETDPKQGVCKVIDLCPTVDCATNYECRMEVVYRIKAPIPPPKPVCYPIDPCKKSTCADGYECRPNQKDPTLPECYPLDPCATVECKDKYHCETVVVNCLVAPCPPSYGQCVADNPCAFTSCLEGTVCTQTENDPTVAECVMTPCATVRCGYNTTCQAITRNCVSPPCPRPRPVCVIDPCANNPCPKDSYCTSDNNIAVCTPIPSCDDVLCEKGKVCKYEVYPCFSGLCPTFTKCVCENEG